MPRLSPASPSGRSSIRTSWTVRLSGLPRLKASATIALAAPSRSFALAAMASATTRGVEMLVDAVGRQQEDVALLELDRPVVDLDLRAHAERAAEIDLLRRQHDAMVVGELLHRVAGDAVDPRIADMEDVRRPRP